MSIESLIAESLERGWVQVQSEVAFASRLPEEVVLAVEDVLSRESPPNRQFLLAIAAGTLDDPSSNPGSLQQQSGIGGVDRRGQASKARDALTDFRDAHGLTLKVSQDAGVSNQWREAEITQGWVDRRRNQDKSWAEGFLVITTWLRQSRGGAKELLDYACARIVDMIVESALTFPRFRVTPRIAMRLVRSFIDAAPNRPDAMEAIVTVGARTLASALSSQPTVRRRDVNSPDLIDVIITSDSDASVRSGIEVTDTPISLSKIRNEVVPAMLSLGLDRATIVSRGTPVESAEEIDRYLASLYTRFQQRIDLATIDVIETWLSYPGTPRDLATDFLWGVGEELNRYSTIGNRRAWYDVLAVYADSVRSTPDRDETER